MARIATVPSRMLSTMVEVVPILSMKKTLTTTSVVVTVKGMRKMNE